MLRRFAMFLAAMGLLLAVPVPYSAQNVGPTLGLEGDHFTVDGVPRFLMSVSYFDATHASSGTWATDLDYLKALVDPNVPNRPVVGVRVLPNWPTNYCTSGPAAQDTLIRYDGTLNGNTLTTLRNFLTAASARGVVVDVTLTRDTVPDASGSSNPMMPFPAYKAGVTAVAAALTGYRNVLFDLQNEYDLGDRLTPPQVQELIQAVHGVDSARIASASQGKATVVRGPLRPSTDSTLSPTMTTERRAPGTPNRSSRTKSTRSERASSLSSSRSTFRNRCRGARPLAATIRSRIRPLGTREIPPGSRRRTGPRGGRSIRVCRSSWPARPFSPG